MEKNINKKYKENCEEIIKKEKRINEIKTQLKIPIENNFKMNKFIKLKKEMKKKKQQLKKKAKLEKQLLKEFKKQHQKKEKKIKKENEVNIKNLTKNTSNIIENPIDLNNKKLEILSNVLIDENYSNNKIKIQYIYLLNLFYFYLIFPSF